MTLRYDPNDEFNKKIINTCLKGEIKTSPNFKLVEKCLGGRELGIQNFGINQADNVFKYCISRESYIENEQGETQQTKLPSDIVKCITCMVDKSDGCDSFLSYTKTERSSQKEAECNCTENRTAESRKKKKNKFNKANTKQMIPGERGEIKDNKPKTLKAIVTKYPAINIEAEPETFNRAVPHRGLKHKTLFKKSR